MSEREKERGSRARERLEKGSVWSLDGGGRRWCEVRTARVELLQRHVYLVVRRRRPPLAQIRAHFGERGLNVGEVKVLRRREEERRVRRGERLAALGMHTLSANRSSTPII